METIQAAHETLESDISSYFSQQGLAKSQWEKALVIIKQSAFDACLINAEARREYADFLSVVSLDDGEDFYHRLTWSFSIKHYATLAEFVKRYEALREAEFEEEEAKASSIEDALEEQRRALFFDEYEMGVPGEVVIYGDRIEVQSFVYQDGFTQQLPRGGEYQGRGTGCWVYPLSKRDHFDKGRGEHWYDFPVLYAPENSTN